MKKHNGVISIWKFIFSLAILTHHFVHIKLPAGQTWNHFRCGAIGVDFFFLVTGYLLALKVSSETRKNDTRPLHISTKDFIMRKMKAIYPYLLFSFIVIFSIRVYLGRIVGIKRMISSLQDLTFLLASGVPNSGIIGGVWYLSAMIIALLLIYPLMKKYKQTYSWIVAPLLAIFIGGYLLHTFDSMRAWDKWTGYFLVGMLKAIFEISLGCTVYEITCWFKTIKFNTAGKALLSFVELFCFGSVWFCNVWSNDVRMFDWLWIMLLMFGIIIAFSENSLLYKACCNSLFYYLERLSLAIYLNNFVFIDLVNSKYLINSLAVKEKMALVFFGAIAISIVELVIIDMLKKIWPKLTGLFKKLFLVSAENAEKEQ